MKLTFLITLGIGFLALGAYCSTQPHLSTMGLGLILGGALSIAPAINSALPWKEAR